MQCPVCGERLRAIQRSQIEIDICPGCKGVWLDRGELEKLIALEGGEHAPDIRFSEDRPSREFDRPSREHDRHHDDHDDDRDRYDRHDRSRTGQQRRRGSWLGDLLGGIGGDD